MRQNGRQKRTQVITVKQMPEHHCPVASFSMGTKQRRLKDFSETVVLSTVTDHQWQAIGKREKKSVTDDKENIVSHPKSLCF